MSINDTIAAISSVAAPSARIIVRVSGPLAHSIASDLSGVQSFAPGSAQFVSIAIGDDATTPSTDASDGVAEDQSLFSGGPEDRAFAPARRKRPALRAAAKRGGNNPSALRQAPAALQCPVWIYAFWAPRSYTGEDSIEFHLPGSPVLAKMLLDDLYRRGARGAEPGEFTARAFFNGKIGLTEAEGVAATIAAGNQAELTAARQLLAGELARRLLPVTDSLAQTLALIEVGIDFTEEDVTFLASEEVIARLSDAKAALSALLDSSVRFEQLTYEPRIVFAGRPNAGKSSLINALSKRQRAIVSDMAGTTRDVLSTPVDLPRGRVLLADIAGIDQIGIGDDPQSRIDRNMQQQANLAIESADHVILVCDFTDDRPTLQLSREVTLLALTKSDLRAEAPGVHPGLPGIEAIPVSSVTGQGMDQFRDALDGIVFGSDQSSATLALNRRHLAAINSALEALSRAADRVIENAPELVAMDLRDVLDALGGVVGQVTRDDVLGRIFSAFCIGK